MESDTYEGVWSLLTGEIDRSSTRGVNSVQGCLLNPIHLDWSTPTGLAAPLADLSPKKEKNKTKENKIT